MPNRITIDIPASVELSPDILRDQETMRDAIAVVLYKQGRITPVQAREIMGLTRRQFEERLSSYGFAMMDEHDFDQELEAARLLSRKQ
ncbi:UPF0175 family protein [Magnetospirillum moscoviense]|uniref:Uncharacterized protein n=1 Tax=Magnetospirillum moscoviense TaxID=1437059 RepID=A0A178MH09_9PROT|nr:UPF0175 family protein [Magnetospirillum moscoviense]OAN47427.1 hypothetical protein A6A05_15730 [Magnetospirillum moscoviense]